MEQSVPGATVNLVPVADAEARAAELDGAADKLTWTFTLRDGLEKN